MNILFLSSKSPYPIKDGHSMRTCNILRQISKKHRIFLVTYFLSDDEEKEFNELKKICTEATGFKLPMSQSRIQLCMALIKNIFSFSPFVAQKYRSKEMSAKIVKILSENKIDVVHIDILPLMSNFKLFKKYPTVLVEHNVESLLLKRRVSFTKNPFKRMFWWSQYLKLLSFEKIKVGQVDCCAVVSSNEMQIIKKMNSRARVEIVPNGVDIEYFTPIGNPQENRLIFVGGLNWFPNHDGMNYFCEKILPEVMIALPNVKVSVVGKEDKNFLYSSQITQLGFVDDVRPHVHSAKVFVVPLRIGGGTRLKILDAMAMGKAIVSTSIGCEGLEGKNGFHFIVEDTAQGFAKAVIELCQDSKKREFLGQNARKLAEEKYSWKLIGDKMNHIYETVRK